MFECCVFVRATEQRRQHVSKWTAECSGCLDPVLLSSSLASLGPAETNIHKYQKEQTDHNRKLSSCPPLIPPLHPPSTRAWPEYH